MKKILLIEDNYDIRHNTAEILELSNYKVLVAENGKIGVEMAMEFKKIQFKESNEYNRREDGKFCQELIIGGYSGLYCPIKLINYIK